MQTSPEELSPLAAYEELMRFAQTRGEAALRLALHASVPQGFHPDLLHLLKRNFVPEAGDDPTIEVDVLFSPLCEDLGRGYFRFDPQVRTLLLDNLSSNYAGDTRSRIYRVANFLLFYVDQFDRGTATNQDQLWRDYLEMQRWVAFAFVSPEGAARQLAAALDQADSTQKFAARVQLGGLASALATPLVGYRSLLNYAAGLQALELGNQQEAEELFTSVTEDDLKVGETVLRPASKIMEDWHERNRTVTSPARSEPAEEANGIEEPTATGSSDFDDAENLKNENMEMRLRASETLGGRDETSPPSEALTVASFDDQIFFNYDHDDNQPLMAGYKGWVDTLHESLARRLNQLIDDRPKIWRDSSSRGDKALVETMTVRLARTPFLVCILSPSYLTSSWCLQELTEFYNRASESGGITIRNRSRIFKVLKTPIDERALLEADLPNELRRLLHESLGYEFYEIDRFTGKLREFWPELGQEYVLKFLQRVEDLAHDIKQMVQSLEMISSGGQSPGAVYLAETTPDLSDGRDELKRILQMHGYLVFPDENLPIETQAFDEKVSDRLSQSFISIHLIGSDHSTITPDDDTLRSRLNLQHEIAAEKIRRQHELAMRNAEKNPDFSRLIWMPAGLTGQTLSYQKFIEYLQNDPAVYENAEVLSGTDISDLKTLIEHKLSLSQNKIEPASDGKRVYLLCDKQDLEAVIPIRDYLFDQGFEVLLPFKGGTAPVSGHKENLRRCDAVLLYYGVANTIEWKLKDLRRIDAFRDRPIHVKAIYVGGPETEEKRLFQNAQALVIKEFGEFRPTSMQPFVDQFGSPNQMSS